MNGEHNQRQPHTIQWDAPREGGTQPAWQGPSPHGFAVAEPAPGHQAQAQASTPLGKWVPRPDGWNEEAAPAPQSDLAPASSAPLGSPWDTPQNSAHASQGSSTPSEPGWAGSVGSGSTADEISHSHPDNSGFGWSGGSGASRFEAPDRADHAPRRDAPAGHDAAPEASFADVDRHAAARDEGHDASFGHRDRRAPEEPYEDSRRHGAPASYASAPSVGQTGTDSYVSAPPQQRAPEAPQVVDQHDELPDDSLTIGRSRSNSIVLDDMLVSRRHVVITADEEGLLLRDLGSRNGTFVNGRRVEQTHLHEGDRIGIGASTFEVRDGWLVSV